MSISETTWNISDLTLKNKTASEWTAANPTLKKGEIGIESNTGKFKFGNGSTNWTSLPYATYTVSEITTALASKANTSAIPAVVNNTTTTTPGSALDAVQGYTLKELINQIMNVTTIAVV